MKQQRLIKALTISAILLLTGCANLEDAFVQVIGSEEGLFA